jgi:hypothetical protein
MVGSLANGAHHGSAAVPAVEAQLHVRVCVCVFLGKRGGMVGSLVS